MDIIDSRDASEAREPSVDRKSSVAPDEELARLRSQVTELQQRQERSDRECNGLRSEHQLLRRACGQRDEARLIAQRRVEQVERDNNELQTTLARERDHLRRAREETERLEQENKRLRAEHVEATKKVEELTKDKVSAGVLAVPGLILPSPSI